MWALIIKANTDVSYEFCTAIHCTYKLLHWIPCFSFSVYSLMYFRWSSIVVVSADSTTACGNHPFKFTFRSHWNTHRFSSPAMGRITQHVGPLSPLPWAHNVHIRIPCDKFQFWTLVKILRIAGFVEFVHHPEF